MGARGRIGTGTGIGSCDTSTLQIDGRIVSSGRIGHDFMVGGWGGGVESDGETRKKYDNGKDNGIYQIFCCNLHIWGKPPEGEREREEKERVPTAAEENIKKSEGKNFSPP